MRIVARGAAGRVTITTDADGEFALRGSDQGALSLAVTDDAGRPLSFVTNDGDRVSLVDVTPNEQELLTLVVERLDGRIDGVVLADDGERIAAARVIAVPDAVPVAERMGLAPASTSCASANAPVASDAVVTTSDHEGTFSFDGLRRDLVYAVYVERIDRPGRGCVGRVRPGAQLSIELGAS
jgi:hypothetical protein